MPPLPMVLKHIDLNYMWLVSVFQKIYFGRDMTIKFDTLVKRFEKIRQNGLVIFCYFCDQIKSNFKLIK